MKTLLVAFFSLILFFSANAQQEDSISKIIEIQSQKFRTILETVRSNYYKDSINFVEISERSFNTLLNSLDPFSRYFNPNEYETLKETYLGTTENIGLNLFRRGDTIYVFNVATGSSSDSAGITVGLPIIFIDNEHMIKKDVSYAQKKLHGTKGTPVSVIVRQDNHLKEYILTRQEIPIPSVVVSSFDKANKSGYIKLLRFAKTSFDELIRSLDSLNRLGMNFLIIDLRGNQGGYFDETVKIVSTFLNKGDTIVIVSGKREYHKVHICEKTGKYANIPLVVLVDRNSASASEIFASAVQDNDRGIVLGERTLGKGTMQKTWEFKDGSAFRITVSEYISPIGRTIQKQQVENIDLKGLEEFAIKEDLKRSIFETIKNFGLAKNLPTYTSRRGRVLLGGGGVFPDYYELSDTLPTYIQKLKSNGFINDFVLLYFYQNNNLKKYTELKSFKTFMEKFTIDNEIMENFRNYLRNNRSYYEQYFEPETQKIAVEIKATLGYTIWGETGYYTIHSSNDKLINRALELKAEAISLLNNRREK